MLNRCLSAALITLALSTASVAEECHDKPGASKEGHWVYSVRVKPGHKCWFVKGKGKHEEIRDETPDYSKAILIGHDKHAKNHDEPKAKEPKKDKVTVLETKHVVLDDPAAPIVPRVIHSVSTETGETGWLFTPKKPEPLVKASEVRVDPAIFDLRWWAPPVTITPEFQLASVGVAKPRVAFSLIPYDTIGEWIMIIGAMLIAVGGGYAGYLFRPRSKLRWDTANGYTWPIEEAKLPSVQPSLATSSSWRVNGTSTDNWGVSEVPEFLKKNPHGIFSTVGVSQGRKRAPNRSVPSYAPN